MSLKSHNILRNTEIMGSPFNSVITPSSLETIAGLIYKPTQHPAWAQFAFAYLMNAGGYTLALTEVASIIDQTGNFDDIDTSSDGVDVNSENADFNGLDTAQIQPDSGQGCRKRRGSRDFLRFRQ